MKRIVSILFAIIMIMSCLVFCISAEEDYSYTEEDFNKDYKVYDPIPLLIVVISFDANGDGVDDFKLGKPVKDPSSSCYGEQWAYSDESYWEKEIFGSEGKTLNNYYRYNSDDQFYFLPCPETYGTENNGVVYVTVNKQHPHASSGSAYSQYGSERHEALKEASKYVDFKSLDTNNDNNLDYTELAVSFIIAGYNIKFTESGTSKQYFGMNNFEVSTSNWYVEIDGVKILNGATGGRFTYNGEYMGENQPIKFGTLAHELGHVLGANDLYTYSGYTWCGGPGEAALQGGGSYLSYSGELAGQSPAAIDPYYLIDFGFRDYEIANDGEYTLYSKESKLGEYNILRVNTISPREYYLIENRYYSGKDTYDAIATNAKGIMIWHVDENVMNSYSLPNCYKGSSKHAPGLTPLYPNGGIGGSVYNAWDKDDGIFDSSKYKFAIAESCYTLMTEEEAKEAGFDFKLEVLSKNGTETKVKITGTIEVVPEYKISCANDLQNEVILKGSIERLNNSTITQIKCELSKKKDYSDSLVLFAEPNEQGKFEFDYKDVSEKSTFYYRVTIYSSYGESVVTNRCYTVSPPNVKTDSYKAFMYKFLDDANRPYEVTVKINEPLVYKFPMVKAGYTLGGWYYDEGYTKPYDMRTTKSTNENIYLYARWINNEDAITLNLHDVEYTNIYFAIKIGEKFDEPDIINQGEKELVGYYSDKELTIPFSFDDLINETGEINVYAKWKDKGSEETVLPVETTNTELVETTTDTIATTNEQVEPDNKPLAPVVVFAIIIAAVVLGLSLILVITRSIKNKNKNKK